MWVYDYTTYESLRNKVVEKLMTLHFFLIGNKTFIQKNWASCSQWWTSDQEKLQQVLRLNLIECKKLEIEIKFVEPQTRAHWNKVPKRRAFKRWHYTYS